jgi:ribonuclease-3
MTPIEERIRYKFRNSLLLAEALTHPSLGHETQRHHFDNQRLEFLGDAVLQLIFTRHLFDRFPAASEGHLTKMRARLVSREGLKVHALKLGLGEFLMMGKGEESSGGRLRVSTLADAFEALVGAIYLDSDLENVRAFVLGEAAPDFDALSLDPLEVNPKGRLQELLQSISPKSPSYSITAESGPEHQKVFIAEVSWNGLRLGSGSGASKKEAESAAAMQALAEKRWKTPLPSTP